MIGGVTRLGGLPGLPGRVTRLAGVAFHVTFASAPKRAKFIKSNSKKPRHWNVAARADNERKRTLTAKMCRSPAIFSVYMPSDHVTTSSNVSPGTPGL